MTRRDSDRDPEWPLPPWWAFALIPVVVAMTPLVIVVGILAVLAESLKKQPPR